ncbi:hypothetical protein NUW58_g8185 [Xylaria curta]|uniref:Uncharacterized protein n=1 Tax=Xylaria curta TaxID=42375 RepID=A0ACC1NAR1_9PEZI|nr:hypothetical protein NUW58_g8185 [Xylaria curta]
MIGSLGDGCTVTIYGNDPKDPICSATNNTLAETSVCYNSTWSYFSVDLCASVDTTRLSSTSIATLATSTTTTTTSTSTLISASSTPTDTPITIAEPASGGVNVGAIVGGTVSGIFVGALLAGAAFYFFWFRPKQQIKLAELSTMQDTSTTRINGSYVEDDTYAKPDSYAKSDARTRTGSYAVLPEGSEVYELSPQYIAEVHEQTHVRHELPP